MRFPYTGKSQSGHEQSAANDSVAVRYAGDLHAARKPLILLTAMSKTHRTFLLVFSGCFAIGGLNHGRDIWQGGLVPYHIVAMPINAIWTALCPLDFAVAGLVWWRRRAAIALGMAILLVDVAVNSWIAYFSGLHVQSFEPLQVQSLFLGFVLGGALFTLGHAAAKP